MRISELIARLTIEMQVRGDVPVVVAGHPGEVGSDLEPSNISYDYIAGKAEFCLLIWF